MTRPLVAHLRKLQGLVNLAPRPGASLKECECRRLDVVFLLLIADAAPQVSQTVIGAHLRTPRTSAQLGPIHHDYPRRRPGERGTVRQSAGVLEEDALAGQDDADRRRRRRRVRGQ